ncbi:hypothetical protein VIGAN_11191500 [Vigna angularis var. angularis]|uniref:Uncharacterized protein n=1 Tax=Vigna angularis var. angularis TaxID=157739 RepID=A0A0S3TB04_PHAAN|nr:hypothetical protein VIGAN_11191500 [Vigna angularis var. angularis]
MALQPHLVETGAANVADMGFLLLPGPPWLRFSQPARVYPVTSIGARAAAIVARTFAFYPVQHAKLLLEISGDTTKRPITNSCVSSTIRGINGDNHSRCHCDSPARSSTCFCYPFKFTTNQRRRALMRLHHSVSRCHTFPFVIQSSTPSLFYAWKLLEIG